jgi:CheY-like chemotaxis protein
MKAEPMPRLLLVEDDPHLGVIVNLLGRRGGMEVVQRTDVEMAWEWLSASSGPGPNLVLLDVNLPRVSGVELCRRMKASEELRAIPIALFIGLSMVGDVAAGWQAGADLLVCKDLVTRPEDWQHRLVEILSGRNGQTGIRSLAYTAPEDEAAAPAIGNPSGGEKFILGSEHRSLRAWIAAVNQTLPLLACRLPGLAVQVAVLERAIGRVTPGWLNQHHGEFVLSSGPLRVPLRALAVLLGSLAEQGEGLLGVEVSGPFRAALARLAPALRPKSR